MATQATDRPNWEGLYEVAATQEGYFTTQQAAAVGYSPQLLAHHIGAEKMVHVRRGIYRLVHFPAGEHEDLVVVWLWSEAMGVFSHQTALALHGLSDVLPARVHLTLPTSWRRRRLRVPKGVALHYADIGRSERSWIGVVPVTSPARTLSDCVEAHLSPELLRQGLDQAAARGLIGKAHARKIERALQPFEKGAE